jgi:hypothetical protein
VREVAAFQSGALTALPPEAGFELEKEYNWKIEHSDFTDEFGFRSFRIVQGTAQLAML